LAPRMQRRYREFLDLAEPKFANWGSHAVFLNLCRNGVSVGSSLRRTAWEIKATLVAPCGAAQPQLGMPRQLHDGSEVIFACGRQEREIPALVLHAGGDLQVIAQRKFRVRLEVVERAALQEFRVHALLAIADLQGVPRREPIS